MAGVLKVRLGATVVGTDGAVGDLKGIVVDPETQVVTHLDVASYHHENGHLVPIERVESTDDEIHLSCTTVGYTEFAPDVVRSDIRDVSGSYRFQYADRGFSLPTVMGGGSRRGMDLMNLSMGYFGGLSGMDKGIAREAVPDEEFELEQRAHIHATDGNVGHVDGAVVDAGTHHLTHLLLAEGHLLGRHEVAIPITAIAKVDADGARLTLSKAQMEALPPL